MNDYDSEHTNARLPASETSPAIEGSTAKNLVQSVKMAASGAAGQLKDQAADIAQGRKSRLAERIGDYSSSIDKNASSWEKEDPNIAWLTHQVADRLRGASDYLRANDFSQIKEDAEEVSRTHPALFFGGLFVLGVIAGNLLKAGTKPSRPRGGERESTLYPEREDVVSFRDEEGVWPEIPASESVK